MRKCTYMILVISIFFLLISSCSSLKRPDGKKGILQGMIYDFENKPVCGYIIAIDGEQKTITDINGRFTVPSVTFGSHTIDGTGKEHSAWNGQIEFNDKTQVLYVKVPSTIWLFFKLDEELMNGNLQEAKNTLNRFSPDEQHSVRYALYSRILDFRTAGPKNREAYFNEAQRIHEEVNR